MANFFRAILLNKGLCELLVELDISHNKLEADGTSEFLAFLSKTACLQKLTISNTSPKISLLPKVTTKKKSFKKKYY